MVKLNVPELRKKDDAALQAELKEVRCVAPLPSRCLFLRAARLCHCASERARERERGKNEILMMKKKIIFAFFCFFSFFR
jgi:hypothetical protein